MIARQLYPEVEAALAREASVALVGPRQVGKTTLALAVADQRPSVYVDLENPRDRAKLDDPAYFLTLHRDKLVILDEIHRAPGLFEVLRGLIDEGRRSGQGEGRFLMLGSASIDLMKQSETLAGRIEYLELGPLSVLETPAPNPIDRLWLRGGFPRSLLSRDDRDSLLWRENFIRTYLERDIPMFGPRVPAETLKRLWTMLAHSQGSLLNASQLAQNLGVSSPTISTYIDLLCDLLVLRRLPPLVANVKKRLVKSPKTYVRDSGLVHALLGIETLDDLLSHPVVGHSWEGMVIETLLMAAPRRTQASFYRTAQGAEADLVLDLGAKHGRWVIEVKRSTAPSVTKGFATARQDLQPERAFMVYPGTERYPKRETLDVIGLRELAEMLWALR